MPIVTPLKTIAICALVYGKLEVGQSRLTLKDSRRLVGDVPGGRACWTSKIYNEDSSCKGDAYSSYSETVGDSVENGCYGWGDGTSYSEYCDSGGIRVVYFSNASSCTGEVSEEHEIYFPFGCHGDDGMYDFDSCSFEGPCDHTLKKSAA
mmetsp:Transcript_28674/g.34926  ORF Transcript_28674/g.34926 Transcript_28674/m.34926 type:complete len:150 (-) Transcript_28674:50-499(-)|eukprot:CAMPEP_0172499542 /NCGR_PEP_ID=MMETSP1066-20121228/128218_1 /TAXON_ID=671091 /ORGANISM="Coscinodiscus wailesii, Strain CCMP2513" /LENGTH=149 /DNA_ID=CAMNT_0013273327 /DNA_START=75 /DNA_END=524 /DNA_ORIENTATION=+